MQLDQRGEAAALFQRGQRISVRTLDRACGPGDRASEACWENALSVSRSHFVSRGHSLDVDADFPFGS